ncbi:MULTISPECIES: PQQ-binding-like beta-propeller repeat protein [unclassified Frankia]|uniref:outer membrane protein assembly factor BamB family protein n=1 Tax=unclassified Frankia TaxID=2632575 RepID=UPI00193447FD|nr:MULTISPECIES: PQQ-binding-like beta-propeller repeat protein [unclassified Frankia]MBL7487592.1 PQQ-binding-like beta-propeller repeat protein [Frankia sp. AgW1.1]MBL7623478.1 PQQ-binding-like beta-propeller repeat protein [Frankia sp. AgB1.8]
MSNPIGEISRVNGLAATVEASRAFPKAGSYRIVPTSRDDAVFAVSSTSADVVRLDSSDLAFASTVVAPKNPSPVLLVGDSTRMYAVVPASGTVIRLDPSTLHVMGSPVRLGGKLAETLVAADSSLWVSDATSGAVTRVALNGAITRVTRGDGDLVALGLAAGQVVSVDARTGALSELTTAGPSSAGSSQMGSAPAPPLLPSADPGSILPALASDGTLYLLDMRSHTIARYHIADINPADLGRPVVGDGRVYVPDNANGTVLAVDLTTRHPTPPVVIPGAKALEVFAKDGMVWVNDPDGPNAAVIYHGRLRPIVKYRDLPTPLTGTHAPTSAVNVSQDSPGNATAATPPPSPVTEPTVSPRPAAVSPQQSAATSHTPAGPGSPRPVTSPPDQPSASQIPGGSAAGDLNAGQGRSAGDDGTKGTGTGGTVDGDAGRGNPAAPGGADAAPASAVGPTLTVTLQPDLVRITVNSAGSGYPFTSYAVTGENPASASGPATQVTPRQQGRQTFVLDMSDCTNGVTFRVLGQDSSGKRTELYSMSASGCLSSGQSFSATPGNGVADVSWENLSDAAGSITVSIGGDGNNYPRTLPASATSAHLTMGNGNTAVGYRNSYAAVGEDANQPDMKIGFGPLWRACRVRDYYCPFGYSSPLSLRDTPGGSPTGVYIPLPGPDGFGPPVQLVCQAQGASDESVDGVWDKIFYSGQTGYINDDYLNTPSNSGERGIHPDALWAGFGGLPICS